MSESGGYDDSYSSQVNYSLSSGSWLETSGTASGTGSGGDHSSYSGTGNYWPAGNGNTMTGAFSNSGSANTTYGYSLNATDSSGNWTSFGRQHLQRARLRRGQVLLLRRRQLLRAILPATTSAPCAARPVAAATAATPTITRPTMRFALPPARLTASGSP